MAYLEVFDGAHFGYSHAVFDWVAVTPEEHHVDDTLRAHASLRVSASERQKSEERRQRMKLERGGGRAAHLILRGHRQGKEDEGVKRKRDVTAVLAHHCRLQLPVEVVHHDRVVAHQVRVPRHYKTHRHGIAHARGRSVRERAKERVKR